MIYSIQKRNQALAIDSNTFVECISGNLGYDLAMPYQFKASIVINTKVLNEKSEIDLL